MENLRVKALAGLYAALGVAHYASAERKFRAGEWATKPLLMPALAAFLLAAAGNPAAGNPAAGDPAAGDLGEVRLPAAGMLLGGLGDTALLASETVSEGWFIPGMGAFAAGHACYIAALAKDGAARGVRPRVAAAYAAAWAVLIAALWRRLGDLRVPVAIYSLLLVAMAVLASGRNREAAVGGALFVASDTLIALDLADLKVTPRQSAAVMPTYVAAQFLLAIGWLRPRRDVNNGVSAS
jgi:uncharacterized membrane protein YhhN